MLWCVLFVIYMSKNELLIFIGVKDIPVHYKVRWCIKVSQITGHFIHTVPIANECMRTLCCIEC